METNNKKNESWKDDQDKQPNTAGLNPLDEAVVNERYGEAAQAKIRDFRTKIDSFYLTAKKLPSSRETALAITAFQSSRQFAGIILGEKGAKYPYPSMAAPGEKPVGQRGDKGEEIKEILEVPDEIERLRTFRAKVDDVITDFVIYMETGNTSGPKEFVAQGEVLAGLLSGKMWMGERMADLAGIA